MTTPNERQAFADDAQATRALGDLAMAAKLRDVGLTEQEVAGLSDPSIAPDERKRRIEAALTANLMRALEEAESPTLATLVQPHIEGLEEDAAAEAELIKMVLDETANDAAARRTKIHIGTALALLVAGGAAFFLIQPNACMTALGPLDSLSALAGQKLAAPENNSADWNMCRVTVGASQHIRSIDALVITLEKANAPSKIPTPVPVDGHRAQTFAAGEEASILVADDASAGPASLPNERHFVRVRRGDVQATLELDADVFTPETAMQLGKQIASRL